MATWNVTGLGDHIPEIVVITEKMTIAVLGISDSRTKGSGSTQYTWSGRDTHAMESDSWLTNNTVKSSSKNIHDTLADIGRTVNRADISNGRFQRKSGE